jgi:hypothetical protein|tara:strand:+ start:3176 stop:3760 length:585 start_codon:yes stop_codon:yes gene_type:complete
MFGFLKKLFKLITLAVEVGIGLSQIFKGVAREMIELPAGIAVGALGVSRFVQTIWIFGISNFFCGMKLMGNFTSCAFYYLLEILGAFMYLIPMLVFMVLDWVTDSMGSKIENTIWFYLEKMDRFTIDQFGFHVIHFSKSVRDKCYNCRRLKPVAFVRKAKDFANDINDPIIPLATGGIKDVFKGFERIVGAFSF